MRILRHSSSSQSSLPFIEVTEGGLYILVRVWPKARKNEVSLLDSKEALRVKLTSAPIDGEANKALIKVLAKLFKIKKSSITITSGMKSRDKRVKLEGLKPEEIEGILAVSVADIKV
jgi:uncharacterized protein (TIGR00251 family)